MDGEVLALIGVVVAQGGLIWYKVGRAEQKIEDICKRINGAPADKTEGKK